MTQFWLSNVTANCFRISWQRALAWRIDTEYVSGVNVKHLWTVDSVWYFIYPRTAFSVLYIYSGLHMNKKAYVLNSWGHLSCQNIPVSIWWLYMRYMTACTELDVNIIIIFREAGRWKYVLIIPWWGCQTDPRDLLCDCYKRPLMLQWKAPSGGCSYEQSAQISKMRLAN